MPTIVKCNYCGIKFSQDSFKARRNKKNYCTADCHQRWVGEERQGNLITLSCDHCGKEFERPSHEVKRRANNFCCYECSREFLKRRIAVTCQHCGKEFERMESQQNSNSGTFCSYACDYEARKRRKVVTCLQCGKEFTKRLRDIRKYDFCGVGCYREWNEGERSPAWQGGKSREPYPHVFNGRLKRKIRHRDDNICQVCGKTAAQEGCNMSVHHIDYDKSNCHPSNLIAVCRSCNAKMNVKRPIWKRVLQALQNRREI